MRPTEKTALVTHYNCLDGSGCAALFVWAGGRRKNVFFRDPKGCALTPDQAAPFDEVWFADICPWDLSDPAGGKPWRVFDHHDTNVRRHGLDCPGCRFDMTKCGTSILLEEIGFAYHDALMFETRGWQMVKAIERYDLGDFTYPDGVLLADLASCYSQDDMVDIMIERGGNLLIDSDVRNMAYGIDMARAKYVDNAVRSALVTELSHRDAVYSCAIAVSPRDWGNSVARAMLERLNVQIAVSVDVTRNSVSLRSLANGPNVAVIAEEYGGGGHPQAAGMRLDSKLGYKLLFEGIFG